MNLFGMLSKSGGGANANEISHEDLAAAIKSKSCQVVDVREPNEYAAGRVPGAINQPLSSFNPQHLPTGKPIILVCKSGARSAAALSKAQAAGRDDVRHYAGGTMGWQGRGEAIES